MVSPVFFFFPPVLNQNPEARVKGSQGTQASEVEWSGEDW